jgi:hypothetical protein
VNSVNGGGAQPPIDMSNLFNDLQNMFSNLPNLAGGAAGNQMNLGGNIPFINNQVFGNSFFNQFTPQNQGNYNDDDDDDEDDDDEYED